MKARLYFAAVLFFMRSRVCGLASHRSHFMRVLRFTQIPLISLNLHA